MEYQNKRGGRVKLQPMVLPQSEFDHPEKGSHAMEVAIKILQLLVSKLDGESMNIERFLELSFWWLYGHNVLFGCTFVIFFFGECSTFVILYGHNVLFGCGFLLYI
ncbi:uncharacterized protein LOC9307452 [Arabidopsis lyrata subsp. lyrata]|uniref:uncharacterized protein LOC9307452 n=1 Tax=Arabidopsis lyrata subsp. lyrata TaxID=81972 RepID=UPI000A29DA23|nr:uncharacterized protein LOC9307452 [Arabidopsis lyrata subsp. lyrata]|eukprot:XP_020877283.1 uncharacterized protein LOC9307452 [Arabidopsis lyrata subsp. lyrata]